MDGQLLWGWVEQHNIHMKRETLQDTPCFFFKKLQQLDNVSVISTSMINLDLLEDLSSRISLAFVHNLHNNNLMKSTKS